MPMSAWRMFARLAAELEHTRALGLRVEVSLCRIAGVVGLSGEVVEDLQQFDLMLQQIAALRDVAAGLAEAAGGDTVLDIGVALDRVKLLDLRARLAEGSDLAASAVDSIFFDSPG